MRPPDRSEVNWQASESGTREAAEVAVRYRYNGLARVALAHLPHKARDTVPQVLDCLVLIA